MNNYYASFDIRISDFPLINFYKLQSGPLEVYKIISLQNKGLTYRYPYKLGLNSIDHPNLLKFKLKQKYFFEGFGVYTSLKDAMCAIKFTISDYRLPVKIIKCFINIDDILGARPYIKDDTIKCFKNPRGNINYCLINIVELWVSQLTIQSLNDLIPKKGRPRRHTINETIATTA